MVFYSKEGTEISKESFIKIYGDSYYSDTDRYVPGVSQTSRFVEDEIDRLLTDGIKTKTDVVHIMAWKLGKVQHKESQCVGRFVYASDWAQAEKFHAMRYGKDFDIDRLATYIVEHITDFEKRAEEDPQGVLDELKALNIRGLGPVYLITLLYFLSRGKYPIYDRFALLALEAINGSKKPGDKVEFHALPDIASKKFSAIMQTEMKSYIDSIKSVFGFEYWKSRRIDRALWVYGHMFSGTNRY